MRIITATICYLLVCAVQANAQDQAPAKDRMSLDCRSFCTAPGAEATLYATWPATKNNSTGYRLYISSGPVSDSKRENTDAMTDAVIVEISRMSAQRKKDKKFKQPKLPRRDLFKSKKEAVRWSIKQKTLKPGGIFKGVKVGELDVFDTPRDRNLANFGLPINGLIPRASFYLLLETVNGGAGVSSMEAYCSVPTCPGHEEGDDDK